MDLYAAASGQNSTVHIDLGQAPLSRKPQIKSAQTSQELVEAMDSIRELQHSLYRPNSSITQSTGCVS